MSRLSGPVYFASNIYCGGRVERHPRNTHGVERFASDQYRLSRKITAVSASPEIQGLTPPAGPSVFRRPVLQAKTTKRAEQPEEDNNTRVDNAPRASPQDCANCIPANENAVRCGDSHPTLVQHSWARHQSEEEYDMIELLGNGGQGSVMLSKRRSDKQVLAVKTSNTTVSLANKKRKEHFMQKFNRQSIIFYILKVAPLEHANIMAIKSFEQVPNQLNTRLVTEFCNGGDLQQLKSRCMDMDVMLPERMIWEIFLQMSRALAFLHHGRYRKYRRGCSKWTPIIHCDIKPENVLISPNPADPINMPIFKLADFDLASFPDTDTPYSLRSHAGTPVWQPPEQWEKTCDPRATSAGDVWALGAIIQYLATEDGFIAGRSQDIAKTITPYQRLERILNGKDSLQLNSYSKNATYWTNSELSFDTEARENGDMTRERRVVPITPAYSFTLHCWMCKALDFDLVTRITATELVDGLIDIDIDMLTTEKDLIRRDIQDEDVIYKHRTVPDWQLGIIEPHENGWN